MSDPTANAATLDRLRMLVFSEEASRFRDEASRHVVGQPYADNRYLRLLDDVRRILGTPAPPVTVPEPEGGDEE